MKNVRKIIIFVLIFLVLLLLTFKVLRMESNPITYFYKEPKNSLDIVYFGGSNVYSHFNSTLAFQEYGFATGLFSYNSQPFPAVKNLIIESEKYQHPNLYVIDISRLAYPFKEISEQEIRRVTDSMKYSKNRNDTIAKLLDIAEVPKENHLIYYLNFLAYHDFWKNPKGILKNIFGNKELYKGYELSDTTIKIEPLQKYEWPTTTMSLSDDIKKDMEDLFQFIKENNYNVLFVLSKRDFEEEEEKYKLNDGMRIIKENGFDVINFNDLDDFDVDYEKDFYNFAHLNIWGGTKYTLYFSKYLVENYDLSDHRGDKKYESWNTEYERFKRNFQNMTGEDFDEVLKNDKKLFK